MFTHKRGVENVIHFQSLASPSRVNYYLHWDSKVQVKRFENLICIGVKKDMFWFLTLNLILIRLNKNNGKLFIHAHNSLMAIMSIYRSNLLTVHDGLYYLKSATKQKFSKLFWLVEKILYLRCDYLHFISDYSKKMSLYTKENFVVIANTSHFESFKNKPFIEDSDSKKSNEEVVKVFAVRSMEERALINLIIDVAEILKNSKFEFCIAGKGPLLEFYKNEIEKRKLSNIHLLGYVPDDELIQYYKHCDIVIVPAAYGEGFGLPIIEGYLFDKVVIASKVCAIPDVICSQNFLFENNTKSIISKLNVATHAIYGRYKEYYDKTFSNKIIVSKMKELYIKLLIN
ncbi:glycosyltransferase [Flavobacterium algicola]|uniref:glycosyltransferase n=1 Tax=Flavobacterium algicola TaxID=556529 RepID=UPI001EFDB472|nr:glycosyltransferase [Flavobacterium algicola]MCG9793926.1 glycosyltransferase [Flavobacterium algicola]